MSCNDKFGYQKIRVGSAPQKPTDPLKRNLSVFSLVSVSCNEIKGKVVKDKVLWDSCHTAAEKPTKLFFEWMSRQRGKRQSVQCPSTWTTSMNNCYAVVKNQVDQPTAETSCRDNGTHLPSVGSSDENALLQSLAVASGARIIWIGLRYEANTGWKWLNQISFTYSNWNDSQPADPSSKRCVVLNVANSGRWETRNCFPDTADGYFCATTPITSGSNPCQSSPCKNGGYCSSAPGNTFSCTCKGGYSGVFCTVINSPCSSIPCLNGGTCVNGGTYYSCNCTAGFYGNNCENSAPTAIQSGSQSGCSVSACTNGGTCISSAGGFLCVCSPGYSGSRCEIFSSRCSTYPCSNGGTCIEGVNEFICKCTDGWSGATCSQSLANCDPNPCKHSGRCFALSTIDYVCKCADGYVGEQCESDVNECDYGICPVGACINTPGSYYCLCQSGSASVPCKNTGASGNGCLVNACQNGGTCVNGSACSCPIGFAGSTCQASVAPSVCTTTSCLNGGTCTTFGGQYSCSCPNGYSGSNCQYGSAVNNFQQPTSCNQNSCQNGAACVMGANGYACQCLKQYTGPTCGVPCPAGWSWSNSVCYFAENTPSNYDQAVATCPRQQQGSYLLTVESQAEFDNAGIIMNQMESNIWLGMKYDVSRGRFIWVTGSPLGVNDFKAWDVGQPSFLQTRVCVRIAANAGFIWQTEDCSHIWKFICKYKG